MAKISKDDVLSYLESANMLEISELIKDIEDNQVVMGYPAVPFKDFIKNWKNK